MNLVVLEGNLGADAQCRYTNAGLAVFEFNLACKNGGGQSRPDWVPVTFFAPTERAAEFMKDALVKGQAVLVQRGEIKTESWSRDNQRHYKTFVVAEEMKILRPVYAGNRQHQPLRREESGTYPVRQPSEQRHREQHGHDRYSGGHPEPPAEDVQPMDIPAPQPHQPQRNTGEKW